MVGIHHCHTTTEIFHFLTIHRLTHGIDIGGSSLLHRLYPHIEADVVCFHRIVGYPLLVANEFVPLLDESFIFWSIHRHEVVPRSQVSNQRFGIKTCKFFLTAGPEERARRRVSDLQAQGESATLEAVLEAQQRRDREDESRPVGPLVRADDAIEVCTDRMSLEEVVDRLEAIVRELM